jgi:hypothetical protein
MKRKRKVFYSSQSINQPAFFLYVDKSEEQVGRALLFCGKR